MVEQGPEPRQLIFGVQAYNDHRSLLNTKFLGSTASAINSDDDYGTLFSFNDTEDFGARIEIVPVVFKSSDRQC